MTDITTKVKNSIDQNTETFTVKSGQINDFVGTDVAPGKQKAIYMSDSSIVGYPGPQLATVRIMYGGNPNPGNDSDNIPHVDLHFNLHLDSQSQQNNEGQITYHVKSPTGEDGGFKLYLYPGKPNQIYVWPLHNMGLTLNLYPQNDEPSYYWVSTGTFQIKGYMLYGTNSNWYYPPSGTK